MPGDLSSAVLAGQGGVEVLPLSKPPDGDTIDSQAVVVKTLQAEVVPGRVRFDHGQWWVTWFPKRGLPAGAELSVSVFLPGAIDLSGNDLTATTLFTFRTAEDP